MMVRLAGILALLAAAILATGGPVVAIECDLDADGRTDSAARTADRDEDGALEIDGTGSATAFSSAGALPASLSPLVFNQVWDTGAVLSNVWCVEAGDADRDGLFDFASSHFAPNVIHLFESDTSGGYAEVWNSSAVTPPGSYRDIAFGDTDHDGLGEIFGGELSTLGKVMLFEQSGGGFAFVHDTIRESDFTTGRQVRSVLLGDTDRDGKDEVIVATGSSSPTAGLVSIWEQSGVVGDNTYTQVFEYTTVSYLFQISLGDADNDGWPEIVLGLGGAGGFPLIIRRIEYDPGLSTWVHQQFTSSVIGLPLTPLVADFDGDGANELAYGSTSFVVIFENTGVNSFTPVFQTPAVLDGTVLSLAERTVSGPPAPSFAAGSFMGDLGVWSFDSGAADWQLRYTRADLPGAYREVAFVDDGADGREEILGALDGSVQQVQVLRRELATGVPEGMEASPRRILAAPNPTSGPSRIFVDVPAAEVSILDARGRRVRQLETSAGSVWWDGRDESGAPAASGVYYLSAGVRGAGIHGRETALILIR